MVYHNYKIPFRDMLVLNPAHISRVFYPVGEIMENLSETLVKNKALRIWAVRSFIFLWDVLGEHPSNSRRCLFLSFYFLNKQVWRRYIFFFYFANKGVSEREEFSFYFLNTWWYGEKKSCGGWPQDCEKYLD